MHATAISIAIRCCSPYCSLFSLFPPCSCSLMIGWQLHLRICFFFLFFICPAPVLLAILTCFLCGMASFPLFFWATGLVVTSLTPCLILNLFCSFSIRPAMANGFHECCGCSWTSQIGDLISSNYQDFLKFGCLFKIAFGRAGGLWGCSFFLLFCSYN